MAWLVGMSVSREVTLITGCEMVFSEINSVFNGGDNYNKTCIQPRNYCEQCNEEEGGSCEYFGLLHSFQVIEMISLVGPIITAGKDRL